MNSFQLGLLAVVAVCAFGKPLSPNQKDPDTCDFAWATYCLKTYIDNFGFNSTGTGVFPGPDIFSVAQSNYISTNGRTGLANTHEWWLNLQSCLGPNALGCLYDDNRLQQIFKTNTTGNDGRFWLVIFLEEDFTHSPAPYAVLFRNYNCLDQTRTHNAASLAQCDNTYFNDVQSDPTNVCAYQVFYMTCLQTVYASNCGSQAGGFVCAEAAIYLRIVNPSCMNNPPAENICYSLT